jgi:subtilisin family serine protease
LCVCARQSASLIPSFAPRGKVRYSPPHHDLGLRMRMRVLIAVGAAGLWAGLTAAQPEPAPSKVAAATPTAASKAPRAFVQLDRVEAEGEEADSDTGQPKAPAYAVRDEILVRFRPTAIPVRKQAILKSQAASARPLKRWKGAKALARPQTAKAAEGSIFDDLVVVTLPPGVGLAGALATFERQPEVLYAEPNLRVRLVERGPGRAQDPSATAQPPPADDGASELEPDDFDFPTQWGLQNPGPPDGTAGADIHATQAWAVTTGSHAVKVAVVDSGIDYFHPDLAANIWTNPGEVPGNGLDDDGNGFIDDVHGYDFVSHDSDPADDNEHGTHVAGILGAAGNNFYGITGVCWSVSLIALKAFDEEGSASLDAVLEALDYAVASGAKIINASWGVDERSRVMHDAVREVYAQGVLLIAAGGNDQAAKAIYPAAFAEALAVAATNSKDGRAFFSNHGAEMDVAAPGDYIFSTLPNNQYDYRSGTSMATPFVSGAAALILSRHPEFTAQQVADILKNTADPIPVEQAIGYGRLNAARAVKVELPLPDARLELPSVLQGRATLRGTAAGDGFLSYTLAYGVGERPANWVDFFTGTAPVRDGVLLADFYTAVMAEGAHAIRLTVRATGERTATASQIVRLANVEITSPQNNDVLALGEKVSIEGTVFGEGRTFTLQYAVGTRASEWLDTGVELAGGGRAPIVRETLGSWDTSRLAPHQFYSLRLVAREQDRVVGEWPVRMVYLEDRFVPGFPRHVPYDGAFPKEEWRDFVVADLAHNGCQDIILVDPADSGGKPARLLVYGCDGRLRWSRELGGGPPYTGIPVAGDIDNHGGQEVFAEVGGRLFGFYSNGAPVLGRWPITAPASGLSLVMADLDSDGKKELIALSDPALADDGAADRSLMVFDAAGNLIRSWRVSACDVEVTAPRIFPAVGNLDGDFDLEIVIPSGCYEVGVFDLNKADGPVWRAHTDGALVASPVIGDLDNDGANEIVLSGYSTRQGQDGGLYVFNRFGALKPGWPVLLEESFAATPALGDVDGDGLLEIAIAGWKSKTVHLVREDGFELLGWPVGPLLRAPPKSNGILGDVDGDGRPDVIFGAPGQLSAASGGDLSFLGGLKAWTAEGWPIAFNGASELMALMMEGAGGVFLRTSPPVLTDLDGDGLLDLIAISNSDYAFGLPQGGSARKNRSTIYAWSLGVPAARSPRPWPAFQHDSQHTGFFQRVAPRNAPPSVADIPDQIVGLGGQFFLIALDQYVEDSDHARAQLTWSVSGAQELQVNISARRIATVRTPSADWAGKETLTFTASDPAGGVSSDEAVFEVRLGYQPPVAAPDQATTPEDTPLEFNLLGNDSSPAGHRLTVASVSKAVAGTVTLAPEGTVTYRPLTNAFGADAFTYLLSDGQGGYALGEVTVEVLPVNDAPEALADDVITIEDTPVTITPLANDRDPDSDPLRLLSFTAPAKGTVTRDGDNLLYTPARDFAGLDTFDYELADALGVSATGAVKVLVKPLNDPPVALAQTLSLNRNSSVGIAFLGTDPEKGELTYKVVKNVEHGDLWAYPASATYYPKKDFVGEDSFTYTASDGTHTSAEATVTLQVLDANNAPTAGSQYWVIRTNRVFKITLAASDLDGDTLSYQVLKQPVHGVLSGEAPALVYQPTRDFVGDDEFTFHASDGRWSSAEATVRLKITDKNSAPLAEHTRLQVGINTPTTLSMYAIDGENDELRYEILSPPRHGTLEGVGPSVRYTPAADYHGPDRFSFRVNDGEFDSKIGSVTLLVQPPNQAPVAQGLSTVVRADRTTLLTLPATDAEADPLQGVILKGPAHGRLAGLGTVFAYTPAPGFLGSDGFTFLVWDGRAYSKQGRVTIQVTRELPPIRLALDRSGLLANGQLRLEARLAGPGAFHLQASTNLVDWGTLSTHTNSGGSATILDTNAANFPRRFYRAVQF